MLGLNRVIVSVRIDNMKMLSTLYRRKKKKRKEKEKLTSKRRTHQ